MPFTHRELITLKPCMIDNFIVSGKAPMKKHSSYITHIDFSCDGVNLHSTCGAYELLFWNVSEGK